LLLSFWQLVIKPKPVQPPTTYMNINWSFESHVSFFVMWRNAGICCMTQSRHASFVNAFFCRLLWVVLHCTTVSIVAIGSVTRSINWVFMHDKPLGTELFTLEIGAQALISNVLISVPSLHTHHLLSFNGVWFSAVLVPPLSHTSWVPSLDYFHITLVLVLDRILTLSYWPGPGIGPNPDFGLVWGKYKRGVETRIRASPVVLSMWSYTTQLDEEKLEYAGLAQSLQWLVKGTATMCTSKKECNKKWFDWWSLFLTDPS
jgi:hypothetical protein